jgi:signal transduction histidine kinase/pSer/pThr/pTyr-binding forkhead associated (FHA) protein
MKCPGCGLDQDPAARNCTGCGVVLVVAQLEDLDRNEPPWLLKPTNQDVGRASENGVALIHASVSRHHARLVWEDGGFTVEDLGSRLGTFVDDAPVTRARLTAGCTLRLGEVRMRYSLVPLRRTEPQARTLGAGTLAQEQGAELLLSVVEALESATTLEDVLERILDAVMKISGAERGFVLLASESDPAGELEVRLGRSRPGAEPPEQAGMSHTVLRRVQSTGEAVVTGDAMRDPELNAADSIIGKPLRTIVCLPLLAARHKDPSAPRVIGALYLDNQALSAFQPERVRAMEGLARHASLALEIARLFTREEDRIRELKAARDQALEASRTKGAFLANMTHELHTPLNAVLNYAEMVLERARELGETDMAGDAEKIRTAGRHLLRIVDDVLDMTRLQEGPTSLNYEPVELSWLVSDLVEKARPQADRNHNALEVRVRDELGTAVLDARRVRQALGHVMSNAAKFTQNGSVVLEAWREAAGDEDWVHFEIADSGIGMTAEQVQRLFDPFSQADGSVTRRYEGTGLGLALTRRICEAMGGGLDVASTPGHGSKFHLRFRAKSAEV